MFDEIDTWRYSYRTW